MLRGDFVPQTSTPKAWFVVFTAPRHEKRVDEHCRIRGIESFLPLFEKKCQWKNGVRKILYLPLFSNYIFVRVEWGRYVPVLAIPGVISIVGSTREKLPVSDSYIHFLQTGVREGKIEPHPYLTEGATVRVRSGAMAGMEGILVRQKNSSRVVLTLEMITRSISVEVEMENIEPISRLSSVGAKCSAASNAA
ncbi:MAG TPA: transcription termination/antitermination NusG family protein [Candidatus Angelobacter sp.]|jgi:transcription antitermination factor NusG|nr:transcription termination/antitermination NusG family protein [Candidatus Angelobacter sp.]